MKKYTKYGKCVASKDYMKNKCDINCKKCEHFEANELQDINEKIDGLRRFVFTFIILILVFGNIKIIVELLNY